MSTSTISIATERAVEAKAQAAARMAGYTPEFRSQVAAKVEAFETCWARVFMSPADSKGRQDMRVFSVAEVAEWWAKQ